VNSEFLCFNCNFFFCSISFVIIISTVIKGEVLHEPQNIRYYRSYKTFGDRVVALPRHKFVTGATLLQLVVYVYPNRQASGESATVLDGSNRSAMVITSFIITIDIDRLS
jgi:hypothetical protein